MIQLLLVSVIFNICIKTIDMPPPIYMYGTACIHIIIYNDSISTNNAIGHTKDAVAWWNTVAPKSNFGAIITTEAITLSNLYAGDTRVYTWYYGVQDPSDAISKAREWNESRRVKNNCYTAFTTIFLPTNGPTGAVIYGPWIFIYMKEHYPSEISPIITHEMGHIYGALDQYKNANPKCTDVSGILRIENQNADKEGCLSNVPSIMRDPYKAYYTHSIDKYALGQIGYIDIDNDSVLDTVDINITKPTFYLPLVVK